MDTIDITVKAVGTKPLLLHAIHQASPTNPWGREMAELRGTRSRDRTDAWYDKMAYVSFMGSLYDIPEIDGAAIPADNLRLSLIGAAKATRDGPAFQRALAVTVPAIPIIYDGPRTPEELWESGRFHLTRMQRTSRGAAPTTYPMFAAWAVRVPLMLDTKLVNLRKLTEVAERAGRIEGLGACRKQGFGRYDALVEQA